MMRCFFISILAVLVFSCNQARKQQNTDNYDVITQQCYVIRPANAVAGDTATEAAKKQQQAIMAYLEQHQFPQHRASKDSLLFRRANGQEVIIELPPPADAWEAHTIIVFDPQKNPLFVNLHKGAEQVERYIKAQ